MRKGLDREKIEKEAEKMIGEGRELTVRGLAERLGVEAASLYNHIGGLAELKLAIARRAAERYAAVLGEATEGREGEDAVRAFALAYRAFARENAGLYRVLMSLRRAEDADIGKLVPVLVAPFVAVLSPFGEGGDPVCLQRAFRSLLHGFVSQEEAGFFRATEESAEESFMRAVELFLRGIKEKV